VTSLGRADDPERSAARAPHAGAMRGYRGSQALDELAPIFARIGLQMQRDVLIERDGRESEVHGQQMSRVRSCGLKVGGRHGLHPRSISRISEPAPILLRYGLVAQCADGRRRYLDRSPYLLTSHLRLLGHFERVVNLDAEVAAMCCST
jgi:hypothetical protein